MKSTVHPIIKQVFIILETLGEFCFIYTLVLL